jgi:hypothetical protein
MANTLLTPTAVTREALRILHQKLNFVGNINRQYDNSFAQSGAKIGDSLKIRLPNQYTVRTGATLSTQDTTESSTTLTVGTQKGVDVNFTTAELSLSMDDFSSRVIEPAMSVLAANIEADALSMVKDVYQQVGTPGTVPQSLRVWLDAKAKLANALAPTSDRCALMSPETNAYMVDALKGLYQDSTQIAKQYREGMMGRTAGADWYENTLLPTLTNGAQAGTPLVNGASQTGSTLVTDGWTGTTTISKGTIFTIAGVYEVHPETKATTSRLQQFVVTAEETTSAGAVTLDISPSIVTSGGGQTVSASPADNAALTLVGTASTGYGMNMLFHKDAFAFATADLILPKNQHFAAREVMDGISMRIVQAYDITNDKLPCRIDVLYGYKAIRPQLACRVTS